MRAPVPYEPIDIPEPLPVSPRKKLLIVSTRVPYPLTDGVRIRIYNTAKYLSRDFDVGLACLTYEAYTEEHLEALRTVFSEVSVQKVSLFSCALHSLRSLWNPLPVQVNFFRWASFARRLDAMAARYDIVLCNHIRTTEYVRQRPWKTLVDLHDSFGLRYERTIKTVKGLMRLFARYELRKIRGYEIDVLADVDHAIIVSELDRQFLIRGGAPPDKITTLNVAVRDDIRPDPPTDRGRSISFLGRIAYAPNEDAVLWFADEVFPVLLQRYPDLTFTVIGIDPTPRVLALRSRQNIVVTGFLENPYTLINDSTVVVAPIRYGAGMQNKVLEAMLLGKPVVLTGIGAEGIDGRDGEHFLVADDAETFARCVSELLDDRPRADALGIAARQLILDRYTWDSISARYKAIIDTILAAPPRS